MATKHYANTRYARVKAAKGAFTKADWARMLEVCEGKCIYCLRVPREKMHIDHVISISRSGLHDATNIVPACASCNRIKNDRLLPDALRRLMLAPAEFTRRRIILLAAFRQQEAA